ncbi:hypothetical protein [Oceanobacillus damuensis]|uniref:hypothetical protein n=1 Tax=Oceanobacillus damuensis TaxID=937928 RepID=UPI0008369B54|nr:hypothetical protein [Oceanobacillus damuensis]
MESQKGITIGLIFGPIINLLSCAILEILVFGFYGGIISAILNFDFEIYFWAVSISILPTVFLFMWFGHRLSKKEMSKKQVWLYSAMAGFVVIFISASIGNGVYSYFNSTSSLSEHVTIIVAMFKYAPVYALTLIPFTTPMCVLALKILSKIITSTIKTRTSIN